MQVSSYYLFLWRWRRDCPNLLLLLTRKSYFWQVLSSNDSKYLKTAKVTWNCRNHSAKLQINKNGALMTYLMPTIQGVHCTIQDDLRIKLLVIFITHDFLCQPVKVWERKDAERNVSGKFFAQLPESLCCVSACKAFPRFWQPKVLTQLIFIWW